MENLLNPDSHKGPWLSCPQDKSGQLKAELQLERVVPISYIDVGESIFRAFGDSEGEHRHDMTNHSPQLSQFIWTEKPSGVSPA